MSTTNSLKSIASNSSAMKAAGTHSATTYSHITQPTHRSARKVRMSSNLDPRPRRTAAPPQPPPLPAHACQSQTASMTKAHYMLFYLFNYQPPFNLFMRFTAISLGPYMEKWAHIIETAQITMSGGGNVDTWAISSIRQINIEHLIVSPQTLTAAHL